MIKMLRPEQLCPNDYNPNEMTAAELKEFVTEVQHLGRLPKPVIVRRNGSGYVIVDGEHGWRAAQAAGLDCLPCEIVEVDDFEARRQTYKRNQHGKHNPVRLGEIFEQMMRLSGCSQRELAKEIDISEGTIRNALAYAKAAGLRNGYAFERLSVRQVRAYLALPESVRDIWLDAGADLKALDKALVVKLKESGLCEFEAEWLVHLQAEGPDFLFETLKPDEGYQWKPAGFIAVMHRMFKLWDWRNHYRRYFNDVDAYIRLVARLKATPDVLDKLPVDVQGRDQQQPYRVLVSPEQWADILATCAKRADGPDELLVMVKASTDLALRRAGIDELDAADPRTMRMDDDVSRAPGFIQQADMPLRDKWLLAMADADVPDDMLLEAKQHACKTMEAKYSVLSIEAQGAEVLGLDTESVRELQAGYWREVTVESALNEALIDLQRAWKVRQREALFSDRDRLLAEVIQRQRKSHLMREGKVGDKPAIDVMAERLSCLPYPEFILLAAHLLADDFCARDAAPSLWLQAVERERTAKG